MFKYLWTISSLARPVPHRHRSILSQNGLVRIQHVRIHKSLWNWKHSALFFGTTTFLCYYGLNITAEEENDEEDQKRQTKDFSEHSKIAPSKVLGKAADEEKHGPSTTQGILEDKNQVVDLEAAIFIPLGWFRECPQPLYKETDPESQSFAHFRKDNERMISVQHELAKLVCRKISMAAPASEALGIPIKVRRFWLDFIIPSGPPPDYEQSGIVITDEVIAWTTRLVPATRYLRLQDISQPRPLLLALWASCRTFLTLRFARIYEKVAFGSKKEDLNNGSPQISLSLQKLIKVPQDGDTQISSSIKDPPPEPTKDPPKAKLSRDRPKVPSNSGQDSSSDDLSPLEQDVNAAFVAFSRTLANNWKRPALILERGTILVSGRVQVVGPNGMCEVDVEASYHPRESRFKSFDIVKVNRLLQKFE